MLIIGDVIKLEKGMKVYGQILEIFVYGNKPLSDEYTRHEIIVGTSYEQTIPTGKDVQRLAKDIKHEFDSHLGLEVTTNDTMDFIKGQIQKSTINPQFHYVFEEGEFVVIDTREEGGGTGMGPHDVYPDGHHVFCKRLKNGEYDENGEEVNFYQTGSFTCMIEDIKPVRHMKRETKLS